VAHYKALIIRTQKSPKRELGTFFMFKKTPLNADLNKKYLRLFYEGSIKYKCIFCDKGGDAVHFVKEFENVSFSQALK